MRLPSFFLKGESLNLSMEVDISADIPKTITHTEWRVWGGVGKAEEKVMFLLTFNLERAVHTLETHRNHMFY